MNVKLAQLLCRKNLCTNSNILQDLPKFTYIKSLRLAKFSFNIYEKDRRPWWLIHFFSFHLLQRTGTPSNRINGKRTCCKLGKRCHKKGIVMIWDAKLYLVLICEQIHGFWPAWRTTAISTRSNDEPLPAEK